MSKLTDQAIAVFEGELESDVQAVLSRWESGVTPTLSKSTPEVKGGPGSGNWGHAGRRGKKGGSVPRKVAMSRVSGRDYQDRQQTAKALGKVPPPPALDIDNPFGLIDWRLKRQAQLKRNVYQDLFDKVRPLVEEKYPDHDPGRATQQMLDVMSLDSDKFKRYGDILGLGDIPGASKKFFGADKVVNRQLAREEYKAKSEHTYQKTITNEDGTTREVTNWSASLSKEASEAARPLVGKNLTEAKALLDSEFAVNLKISKPIATDSEIHAEISQVINLGRNHPAIKRALIEGVDTIDYAGPRPGNPSAVASYHGSNKTISVGRGDDFPMQPSVWTHEIGHAAQPLAPKALNDKMNRGKRFSNYAWENDSEDFAETWTMVVGGQSQARPTNPAKYDAMKDFTEGL